VTLELIRAGGDLAAFERLVGPGEQIEDEWQRYVRRFKAGPVVPRRSPQPVPR